jgi:hypothetical protein
MIVEERIYSMVPGGVPRYVELWKEFGREAQVDCLGEPLGVYTCEVGDLNTLTYMWRYESIEERATRRARLQQDKRFAAFRTQVRDLIVQQHNRILVPVDDHS